MNAVAGQPGMPLVPVREAAARVAVMEAAYRSSKAGTTVKVGYETKNPRPVIPAAGLPPTPKGHWTS